MHDVSAPIWKYIHQYVISGSVKLGIILSARSHDKQERTDCVTNLQRNLSSVDTRSNTTLRQDLN